MSLNQDGTEVQELYDKDLEDDDDYSDNSDPMYLNKDPKACTNSAKNIGKKGKERNKLYLNLINLFQ